MNWIYDISGSGLVNYKILAPNRREETREGVHEICEIVWGIIVWKAAHERVPHG